MPSLSARLVASLLAFTVGTVAAGAEPTPEPDASMAPTRIDPAQLDRAQRSAKWRRNVGIGLATPGMALLILGGVLVTNGALDPSRSGMNPPHLASDGTEIASGSVVAAVGLPLALAGIVLWILGQDDLDVVSWRRKQQEKNRLSLLPNGVGIRF